MPDRPIIFSGPMVRALLDGRKTQTRRVLKPQPPSVEAVRELSGSGYDWLSNSQGCRPVGPIWAIRKLAGDEVTRPVESAPGDRLWVRETWAQHHPAGVQEGRYSIEGRAGIPGPPRVKYRVIYRADGDPVRVWHCEEYPYRTAAGPRDELDARHPDVCSEFPGWLSPIHMPRWASRLTLTVTDVRVQRVQEISEEDARAEGPHQHVEWPDDYYTTWIGAFRALWDHLHAKRGYRWDANPWVVAISFEVHHCNIDQLAAREKGDD